jgi:hypothetical protein
VSTDALGLWVTLAFVGLVCAAIAGSRLSLSLKALLIGALALRVVGTVAYFLVILEVYNGRADAVTYYFRGLEYSRHFQEFDFAPLVDPDLWHGSRWWGTQFIAFPTGFVLTLLGPTMLGASIVFSLLSFMGLIGFAIAFRRCYPGVPVASYARWIWLFPALSFWPSTIGKEAMMLLGLGIATMGFAGRNERIQWLWLLAGLSLLFAVRPQVAAVVICTMVAAQWFTLNRRWSIGRMVQGVAVLGAGLFGVWFSMRSIGVDGFDVAGVQMYMDANTATAHGESRIEAVGLGWRNVPVALVNILLRPFPWEATKLVVFVSALEIWTVWAILWWRRRSVLEALRRWRSDRVVCFTIGFIIMYSIGLGMLTANLGLIARQRVVLFPFVFLLLEAAPVMARVRLSGSVPLLVRTPRPVRSPSRSMAT